MPKLLDIILHPNPILREKCVELTEDEIKSKEIKALLLDMEETMQKKDGAGLAAPQVGKTMRLMVINDNNKTLFMLNPKITKRSWAKAIDDEGCLSILDKKGKNIYGKVSRHKKIKCNFIDEKGKKRSLEASDMLARAIQHEIDHLDGILFIDRLVDSSSNKEDKQNN